MCPHPRAAQAPESPSREIPFIQAEPGRAAGRAMLRHRHWAHSLAPSVCSCRITGDAPLPQGFPRPAPRCPPMQTLGRFRVHQPGVTASTAGGDCHQGSQASCQPGPPALAPGALHLCVHAQLGPEAGQTWAPAPSQSRCGRTVLPALEDPHSHAPKALSFDQGLFLMSPALAAARPASPSPSTHVLSKDSSSLGSPLLPEVLGWARLCRLAGPCRATQTALSSSMCRAERGGACGMEDGSGWDEVSKMLRDGCPRLTGTGTS